MRWAPSARVELRGTRRRGRSGSLLAVAGAVLLGTRRRRLGIAALVLAALWALDEGLSLGRSEQWSAGQLISLACGAGLIATTALIAREVWPENRGRWIAAGAFAAAYPVVYRMSILFHPEMPFALLCALATLVVLRAQRRGFPARLGWWLGAALGAAALTRQPAVLVMGCLAAASLWLGRPARRRLPRCARWSSWSSWPGPGGATRQTAGATRSSRTSSRAPR